jgi:hypothetical protein
MLMKRTNGLGTTETYTLRREDALALKVFGELRNSRSIVLAYEGLGPHAPTPLPSQTQAPGH